jgi:type III secretion system chaperone SycN
VSWIEDTIAAFGRTIGILDLALDERKRVDLAIEGGGLIVIRHLVDRVEPELLLCRSRAVGSDASAAVRGALRISNFRRPHSWPIQAALEDGQLTLAMRVPERGFTLDVMERAFAELERLHSELAAEV